MKRLGSILLLLACSALGADSYRFIFDGDSISQNNPWNLTNSWFASRTVSWTNIARGGWALGDLFSFFYVGFTNTGQGDVVDQLADAPTINIVYTHIGANDLTYPTSGSLMLDVTESNGVVWYGHLTNLWWQIRSNATQRSKIVKVIGSTILPAGSGTTFDFNTNGSDYLTVPAAWTNINTLIRAGAPTLLDYFCDNALVLPDTKAAPYAAGDSYGDGVIHPNLVGMRLIVSNLNYVLEQSSLTYYVDCLATNGLNNGTSWANAWTSLLNLSEESNSVPAGSMVYISGGDYLMTNEWAAYDSVNLCCGTAGNVTTYRHAASPSEASPTVVIHATLGVKGYTILDGSITPGYTANIGNNTFAVPLVISNTAIILDSRDEDHRDVAYHAAIIIRDANPFIMQWVGMIGWVTDWPSTNTSYIDQNTHSYNKSKLSATTDYPHAEIAYCWVQGYPRFSALSPTYTNSWGNINIHHCLLETNYFGTPYDDSYGPNIDFHHNFIRNRWSIYKHTEADGFQLNSGTCGFSRIHHNIFEPNDNDFAPMAISQNFTNWFWYCNLIRPHDADHHWTDQPTTPGGHIRMDPVALSPSEGLAMAPITMAGVYFLNNTVIMSPQYYAIPQWIQLQNMAITDPTNATSPRWCDILDSGLVFKNNLDHGCLAGPAHTLGGATTGSGLGDMVNPWRYGTNSIVFDYNLWSSTNAAISWVLWARTNGSGTQFLDYLTNSSQVAAELGYTNNVTLAASFYDESQRDYRPTSSAMVMGQNLTSLTNLMPDIDKDLYGNQRPVTGPWTAGAIEYQASTFGGPTNGLVLWLQFDRSDNWTNGGYIPDHSGWTNHAYVFDPPSWFETNGVHTAPILTNGPNGLPAGLFITNYTDAEDYTHGTYAGVTNYNGGWQTMTQGTWCAWAKFFTRLGAFSFMDVAYSLPNNWLFGAWYTAVPSFTVYTNASGSPNEREIEFPDTLTIDLDTWHHYAVTWDGANFIGYYNGSAMQTNSKAITSLVSTNPLGGAYSWVGIGVMTHGGTPDPADADGLPNNGQMNGAMADMRIYNRALSAAEVGAIYGATNAPAPPTPPETNSTAVLGVILFGGRPVTSVTTTNAP